MRTWFRSAFASIIILLLSSAVFAGDFASLDFIGFSADGRYAAFEEYGTQDGSGYPYSNIYVLDTAKNAYAAPRVAVIIEDESGSERTARTRAAALSAKKLKQFGIVKGNKGKHVVSHLITDLTYDDGRGTSTGNIARFAEEMWSMHREGDHEVLLTPIKYKAKDCDAYEQDTFILELKLTDKNANTSKLLQKDSTLPASRGCALYYRIQDVYIHKGFIAVFINVFTQGFEGPDMRFMAITGTLK